MIYQRHGISQGIFITGIIVVLLMSGCEFTKETEEVSITQPVVVQPKDITDQPAVEGMIEPTVEFGITQVNTTTIEIESRPSNEECPHLVSRLYDLSLADDPESFARTNGLYFSDSSTRIVIEVSGPGEDISFLSKYDVQIETQTEALVQAIVPITRLCDLSNDPQVIAVREPRTAITP